MAARYPGGDWTTGPLPGGTDTRTVDTVTGAMFSPTGTYGETLALVAVHDGRVVLERYGEGSGPGATHISWSMAKSITHALVGIAVGDGTLRTGDDNLFPEWSGDGRAAITLQHLLNMSSGL
jgi:CubicO group peptidase (beta-lactamase class C family)